MQRLQLPAPPPLRATSEKRSRSGFQATQCRSGDPPSRFGLPWMAHTTGRRQSRAAPPKRPRTSAACVASSRTRTPSRLSLPRMSQSLCEDRWQAPRPDHVVLSVKGRDLMHHRSTNPTEILTASRHPLADSLSQRKRSAYGHPGSGPPPQANGAQDHRRSGLVAFQQLRQLWQFGLSAQSPLGSMTERAEPRTRPGQTPPG